MPPAPTTLPRPAIILRWHGICSTPVRAIPTGESRHKRVVTAMVRGNVRRKQEAGSRKQKAGSRKPRRWQSLARAATAHRLRHSCCRPADTASPTAIPERPRRRPQKYRFIRIFQRNCPSVHSRSLPPHLTRRSSHPDPDPNPNPNPDPGQPNTQTFRLPRPNSTAVNHTSP